LTRVLAIERLEDCFDGSFVRQYRLDAPVTEELMRAVAQGGDLHYFPDFPRPYFRIRRASEWVIQGVIGNDAFRATFSRNAPRDVEEALTRQIEGS
jgi:hypothetical protein